MSSPVQTISYERPGGDAASRPSARLWPWLLLAMIVTAAAFYFGKAPRAAQHAAVIAENKELAAQTVAVVRPRPGKVAEALALPAELKPLTEADIYARANGYVKKLLVDIGAKVEEGQLLAEIDAPELARELEHAKAELVHAQAQLDLAKTTAERWAQLVKTNTVSEQDNAEKQADVRLQSANVESMRANVRKIEETLVFTKVVAPFKGTITAREMDVGDLITQDKLKPLFHLAHTRTLRAFVNVPQALARGIRPELKAELTLPDQPGHIFEAKVVRTAGALDAGSRTLLTELHVDNSKNELLAGSFSQIRFPELKAEAALTLPANCLLIRAEGPQVAVVGDDNRAKLHGLTIGRDFGNLVEVVSGVTAQDRVIVNPPDAITDDAEVRVTDMKAEETKK